MSRVEDVVSFQVRLRSTPSGAPMSVVEMNRLKDAIQRECESILGDRGMRGDEFDVFITDVAQEDTTS